MCFNKVPYILCSHERCARNGPFRFSQTYIWLTCFFTISLLTNSDVFFFLSPELEFHLRCHGDLLFKCAFCPYSHYVKRTAERHVAEEHPAKKKLAVRDVRKDMAEQASADPASHM